MKTVILVKDGEVADYPSDIMVDGEVRNSYNLEFECINLGAKILIGKSLPSDLITDVTHYITFIAILEYFRTRQFYES